jgi:ABC-type cobalamin/Fe3+-siderophores transport system ATPase subunit
MVMEQAVYRPAERPAGALAVLTTGLTKRFGDRVVVDDVALAIPSGSVCGFVGPNGAGKTTTIRMLLGLVRPTSGTGTILGGSLAEPAAYLHKVGALIEAPAFYPQLTGTIGGALMSYVLVPQEPDVMRLLLKLVVRTSRWAALGLSVGDLTLRGVSHAALRSF